MTGSLILAGGGDAPDSLPLDQLFASWVRGGKLLYLPVAMDGISPTYPECRVWLKSVFNPLGVTDIDLCTDLHTLTEQRLSEAQGVYIGGGNTYRLLHVLRETGYTESLIRYVQNGGKVYGGSAGAIIWGREISVSQYADPNEVGLQDTRGFNKVGGYTLWCHYVPEDAPTIHSYIEQYNLPLLALSERSGLLVENDQIAVIGYEPVLRITQQSQTLYPVGETIPPF